MSKKWHGGKGDARRTRADDSAYQRGWDRIFGTQDTANTSKQKDTSEDKPK